MKNKILIGKEMVAELKKGMDIVHTAVAATMGAAGKNALYRSDYSGRPISTNDGISIARRINLEDEAQSMGAELITQAAERTNEEAGDGTTTAMVLTYAMIEKGLEKIDKGVNAMVLRRQMQESVDGLVQTIKGIAIPIKTDEELFNIANISMENPEVAKIIAESVKKVGEDGIVLVEESAGLSIERKDIEGMKFDKGYVTPYMATNPNTMEAVLSDVHILVTDKSFQLNRDIFPLLEALSTQGVKKLVIICSGMQGEILATVIRNKFEGKFICVVVEKPYDENMLEDIAIFTGSQNITTAKHPGDIGKFHLTSLGMAEKIVVTKDSTLIIGGKGEKTKIEERINAIKNEIKDTEHGYTKDRLKERLAKLIGSIVILKVGAPTEAEMKYMRLKIDDAVAATRAALQEGIVVGGGKMLFEFSLSENKNDGDEVVKFACAAPMKVIMKNAGCLDFPDADQVFNALTGKMTTDPLKDGIIDPAKVERCALQNAVSAAGIFLTSETAIIELPEKHISKDESVL